jgi:flagellar export protein FliJ
MKSLRTLLKLARRDLETLRRALGEQIVRLQTLEQRIIGHDEAVKREQALAAQDYESARAYGGYAVAAVSIRRALEAELGIVADEIAHMRELIAAAHVEMRKFERLIELGEAREKAAREKRENAELDEFATMQAGRAKA